MTEGVTLSFERSKNLLLSAVYRIQYGKRKHFID